MHHCVISFLAWCPPKTRPLHLSQTLLGESDSMQEIGMGQESVQAEERYLTKCTSGIGPEMSLLKAKVCMPHPTTMACSRFLTSAEKKWLYHEGGKTPAGRGEQGKGTKSGASSNQVLHSNRHGAPNLDSESKGKFGTSRTLGTSTPSWHSGALPSHLARKSGSIN